MFTNRLSASPLNARGGQDSFLLLTKGQFGSQRLSITWVEGPPGSEQPHHTHPESEQVYVIVKGRGLMMVGDEEQEVGPGMLVFIPPGTPHAIRNTGSDQLLYVSAAAPPWDPPPSDSPLSYGPSATES
jgi:mannose-6-phosphate isomerase-like protein (cupin superfamily)